MLADLDLRKRDKRDDEKKSDFSTDGKRSLVIYCQLNKKFVLVGDFGQFKRVPWVFLCFFSQPSLDLAICLFSLHRIYDSYKK